MLECHSFHILFYWISLKKSPFSSGSNDNPASRAIHAETNQLGEKFSKIFYFAATKLAVPGLLLPKAMLSYFIYFTTDAGRAAFDLPFPAWLESLFVY